MSRRTLLLSTKPLGTAGGVRSAARATAKVAALAESSWLRLVGAISSMTTLRNTRPLAAPAEREIHSPPNLAVAVGVYSTSTCW